MEIWQLASEITKTIHNLIKNSIDFQLDNTLVDQIKRSSGSAMNNLAEGFERDGKKEFIQFLSVSKGSKGETHPQSYRAPDYEYITNEEFKLLCNRLITLNTKIQNFITYLKNSNLKGGKYKTN